MSLPYPDPALPSNPNPYFTDNSFARGDQQRANNGFIWANLEDLDARVVILETSSNTLQEQIDDINEELVGRLGVPRRQSILSGNVDSDGFANFLSASGLNVSIDATPTPIVLAFAAGFDDAGAINYVAEISLDVANAWTLPATPTVSGNMTRSSQTVTINTTSAHGITTGDYVWTDSVTANDYQGERAATVVDSDTITVLLAGTATPTTPATSPVLYRVFFLYVDRNISTGTLTYGYSTQPPVYAVKAPSGPVTGQHFFDLNLWKMYVWDGAEWDEVQRIFVGDAWTAAASMTLRNWPLLGGYRGAGYNTTVTNADDLTSFGYSMDGGIVPSVATSAKTKYVKVGSLREGQSVAVQMNYLPTSRNYSAHKNAWFDVNFLDSTTGGMTLTNLSSTDGTVSVNFYAVGFLGDAWANAAARGVRYRVIVKPLW